MKLDKFEELVSEKLKKDVLEKKSPKLKQKLGKKKFLF